MIFKSRRFWILVAGTLISLTAMGIVAIKPESRDAITTMAPLLMGLLGVGVYSEGQRPMGSRD